MKNFSIGYNNTGQSFFDYLKTKEKYVHSYFFSPTHDFYKYTDWKEELKKFEKYDTYNFEANILFNLKVNLESRDILKSFLNLRNINLTSVTILNQESINLFKKVGKGLKYHVSVNTPIASIDELHRKFNISDIYCVNLDYKHIFDFELMDKIKNEGIKVKIIPNESCLYGRTEFFKKIDRVACVNNGYCGQKCWEVLSGELEWLNLTRQGFNEWYLPLLQEKVDIIKLSTRGASLEELHNTVMSYVIQQDEFDLFGYKLPKEIAKKFINKRICCSNNCFECKYCKYVFEKYIKGENKSGS